MGLMWIPVAIGIQLLLLYVVLGGPGRVLAGFSGQRSLLGIDGLGTLQIGLPVAMLLAFPSLAALAAVEKWVHPVGWLDVVIVQGLSLVLMLRRLRRSSAAAVIPMESSCFDSQELAPSISPIPLLVPDRTASALPAACAVELRPYPAVSAAAERLSQVSSVPDIPMASPVPGPVEDVPAPATVTTSEPEPVVVPAQEVQKEEPVAASVPAAPLEARKLARELAKIYGWNGVGLERPFVEARSHFRVWDAGRVAPDARLVSWRRIARDTLSALRQDGGALPLEEFFSERVLEADEYEQDVMRRLSFSVLVGHDRLFIDPSDIEMCGEDVVVAMYCQALLELGAEGGVTYH